jgi:Oxidoreductase family, NAD-binding Rossmann fold
VTDPRRVVVLAAGANVWQFREPAQRVIGAEVVAVHDVDQAAAHRVADALGCVAVVGLDELLRHDADLAVVMTSHVHHADLTRACLRARPGLATVGVLSFLWGWGDLVFALTLTSDESKRVVTTGLANFFGAFATDWAGAMAFCSLAMLPPLVVFVLAQRQVIAGLTMGGTKG